MWNLIEFSSQMFHFLMPCDDFKALIVYQSYSEFNVPIHFKTDSFATT